MLSVVCVNVNGIRAFARRGGLAWLGSVSPDVVCLQEVRATDEQLHAELDSAGLGDFHVSHAQAAAAGRSGVAILSRNKQSGIRSSIGKAEFADSGRWTEATIDSGVGSLTVVSVYIPKGEIDGPRREAKDRFLKAMSARMKTLRAAADKSNGHVLICGDFNIAHTELDIKNWRGNVGRPGFMDSERAVLDGWFGKAGWVDLGRRMSGDNPGPYTWWSWRGKAFDTDAGWRIDYQVATPELASHLRTARVSRASSYAERASDHAPVVVEFGEAR